MKNSIDNRISVVLKPWQRAILVAAFAMFAGLLSVLPSLLAINALGEQYQGIPYMYNNDEDHYLARVQEIADGYYYASSMFFYEYKEAYSLVPPIGEGIFYLLSSSLGLAPNEFLTLSKFFYPTVLFFFVYLVFTIWTKSEASPSVVMWGGIATATAVTIGIGILNYRVVIDFFMLGGTAVILPPWTRPINPVTGAIFIFAALYLLQKFSHEWSVIRALVTGLIVSVSAGYIFSFELLLAIIATSVLFLALRKDWQTCKWYVLIGFTALTVPVLYWSDILPHLSSGAVGERNGIEYGFTPKINKVLAVTSLFISVIFITYVNRSSWRVVFSTYQKKVMIFIAILLFALYGVFNKQIILGLTVSPDHFYIYSNALCILMVSLVAFAFIRPRFPRVWAAGIVMMIVFPISYTSVTTFSTYHIVLADFAHTQNLYSIAAWFDENAPPDCVVLVSETLREKITKLIPAFTACNVYRTTNLFGVIPMERVYHNFFIRLRLEGVTATEVHNYLWSNPTEITASFYEDWYDLTEGPDFIDETLINELSAAYQDFLLQDFKTQLQLYRIDYILTTDGPPPGLDELPDLKPVHKIDENIIIYALNGS